MKHTDDIHVYAAEQAISHQLLDQNPEPVICSVFGCGRKLTMQEHLFGGKCINHSITPALNTRFNMENRMLTGSLCLTDIVEKAKQGHSAFSKAANGKIYFNILQWLNSEPDKFGNTSSIQLNSKKEKKDEEGKCYIGNAKFVEKGEAAQATAEDIPDVGDLPF